MTEKLQVSKRLDDGTIVVVGGDSSAEFAKNLEEIGGVTLRDEVRALFLSLIPDTTAPSSAPSFQQAVTNVQQGFTPPATVNQASGAPLCPNHGQPAKFVPGGIAKATGQPYQGFFACAVSAQGDRSCKIRA